MSSDKIIITQYSHISCADDLAQQYTGLRRHFFGKDYEWAGKLSPSSEDSLSYFLKKYPHYHQLDRTVHLALLCADKINIASKNNLSKTGVNIGSSRGATHLLEKGYDYFLKENTVPPHTSPYTSLGNISSWVGQHLQTKGIQFSHSMTCSTSLLSIANGVAWIKANLANQMLVGGSEAPLTPFTLAQSKALRIYSRETEIPCLAGAEHKNSNTMVLGEGAGIVLLEKENAENTHHSLGYIAGIGYASETISSATGISPNAENLQKSMRMALQDAHINAVDVIITHTPGTKKGDASEMQAIRAVFREKVPYITNNKWKIGHTFGASGILSLIYGLEMFLKKEVFSTPWEDPYKGKKPPRTILINGAGFGGNAVSIIIRA